VQQPQLAAEMSAQLLAGAAPHPVHATIAAGALPPLALAGCEGGAGLPQAPSRLSPRFLAGGGARAVAVAEPSSGRVCNREALVLDVSHWVVRVDPKSGAG